MTDRLITLERDGALAIVSFDDPESMNAMSGRMCDAFAETMDDVLTDRGVRAVLLTGAGAAFCAGANLKEMLAVQDAGGVFDVGGKLRDAMNPTLANMVTAPKPIVAAVNGAAVGVGCGVALAADIVLVGRSGYFLQSFARLGAVPDGGSSWLIPRLAGRGRAAAMMLLGERIGAEQAVAWGLAHEMLEDEALLPAAHAMALRFANGPTGAYARIKTMLALSAGNSFAAQLALEAEKQVAAFDSADCREGIAAFAARRAPVFTGG